MDGIDRPNVITMATDDFKKLVVVTVHVVSQGQPRQLTPLVPNPSIEMSLQSVEALQTLHQRLTQPIRKAHVAFSIQVGTLAMREESLKSWAETPRRNPSKEKTSTSGKMKAPRSPPFSKSILQDELS